MPPEVIIHNSITLDNCFTADAFSKKSADIALHYTVLLSFSPDALPAGENYRKIFENVKVSMEFELLKTECKENGIIHCLYSVQKQKN